MIEVWRWPDAVAAARQGELLGDVAFAKNPHGKPHVEGGPHFNRSHSGGFLLFAMSRSVEVGVDLEAPRTVRRRAQLLARSFSPAETAWIGDDEGRLLRAWAAKEAVVKAIGRGIAFGLKRVELDVRDDRLVSAATSTGAWTLHELSWDDGYVGAVAWTGGPLEVRAR